MSEPEELAGYPIAFLAGILVRVLDDAVMAGVAGGGYGDITRAQGIVFEMVDPGGARISDMARRARMTKQAMGQLVAALEDAGYVERVPDPDDGRAQLVRVTPAGEAAAAAGRDSLLALERAWRDVLGDRRYETTRRALVDLVRATGLDHVR